jgi:GxxExxY protein
MYYELSKEFDDVRRQQTIPLIHEELYIAVAFRADLIVESKLLIELKSVEEVPKVDYKRMNTYLKLAGYKLGLLINFNVPLIKDGIKRM